MYIYDRMPPICNVIMNQFNYICAIINYNFVSVSIFYLMYFLFLFMLIENLKFDRRIDKVDFKIKSKNAIPKISGSFKINKSSVIRLIVANILISNNLCNSTSTT